MSRQAVACLGGKCKKPINPTNKEERCVIMAQADPRVTKIVNMLRRGENPDDPKELALAAAVAIKIIYDEVNAGSTDPDVLRRLRLIVLAASGASLRTLGYEVTDMVSDKANEPDDGVASEAADPDDENPLADVVSESSTSEAAKPGRFGRRAPKSGRRR
jgi:hypothetical protein